jgi:hypothetical protein
VSVCGTVTIRVMPNEDFLDTWGQRLCGHSAFVRRFSLLMSGFACSSAYTPSTGMPSPVSPTLVCPPIAPVGGSGILTGFPSPTPFGLGLGTDLPCADRLDAGNLRFSARRVLTCVIATYADKVFSTRSRLSPPLRVRPFGTSSLPVECSPTIKKFRRTPRS